MFGSDSISNDVIQLVIRFNDALNLHDVDGMMAFLTADCVFENTYPPPDGTRYEGFPAVRTFWKEFFEIDQGQKIEIEEIFASGDRCAMRWVYHWNNPDGREEHIRGVDLYTVRDGQIAEKLSYVKG